MKSRIIIGTITALSCLAMPFLCRMPRGPEWVAQYFPDQGILGALFFGAFMILPGIVTFVATLLSKRPLYLPGVLATAVALIMLAYLHYDDDLAADAQASMSLMITPIVVAVLTFVAGLSGLGIQWLILSQKTRKE